MPEPVGETEVPEAEQGMISGRYEVIRVLGEGSSARTLLCSDVVDGRRVAIKEMHIAHVGDWKHLELFEREAKTLSMLDHSGIPAVYDFFQSEGDASTLYIVQEFIEGRSLQQRMESGPMLGQDEIHELARSLLDVLEYLHGRAPPILHRDIKPSNVLLRPDGGPALIDFGGVCVGWRPPDTAGTTVVGTFGYMPPEQLVGQGGPTSDLYALGATLLHVVTGQAPSDFPFDSGRIEVPANLPIPEPLARLIEALLRPAPRDRPQTAEAARRILSDAGAPDSAVAKVGASAPPVPGQRAMPIYSGEGPRFVDMGEPPRHPGGEFRDVYANLIHPWFPANRLRSGAEHVAWLGLFSLVGAVTVGGSFVFYLWHVHGRRRKYDDLFRHGRFTSGVIRHVNSPGEGGFYSTFKYEFEAAGSTYVAYMKYTQEMARYWTPGDVVPVLHDPDDPTRSCFVYR